ncbi:unnamed protein product [Sphenostylis stenocarpa]|uniref:Uncharacterized protein n=1 Tax=Sphenostylis stenocarpa TaxID=92480 RepID=A0AA86RNH4_9FABA|nr:unnamed protein product [Sphenostylis stenocarpa]
MGRVGPNLNSKPQKWVWDLLVVRVSSHPPFGEEMETQSCDGKPQVKATFRLGSESYTVEAKKGSLSEQLVSLKEESMTILKDFITKHNVPHDVPDESLEAFSSEDDDVEVDDIPEKPQEKSKKTKLT